MIVHKGFQFKLDPTVEQQRLFRHYCGATRWVWNRMLAERKTCYLAGNRSPTTNDQIKQLPLLKRQPDTAWLKTVHSQVLQDAVLDLGEAFTRFFNDQNGKPKYKKKHGHKQSFSYPQGVKVDGEHVWLPKIGWVRFRKSRELEGKIKRATVRRKPSGWYISLTCILMLPDPEPVLVDENNSVGIDLGSIDLISRSNGRKTTNPRYYRKMERKLAREQRGLSRRQPGSNNYRKQQHRVALLHEQVSNRRRNTLHQLSRQLVDENQAIFCENLNVQGMARRLGKSVGDAGWSELLRQLNYKARWTGKTFLQIGRFYPSSKCCSWCEYIHTELSLSERIWKCPNCGMELDRDINAAINIHREGLRYLAVGHTES